MKQETLDWASDGFWMFKKWESLLVGLLSLSRYYV